VYPAKDASNDSIWCMLSKRRWRRGKRWGNVYASRYAEVRLPMWGC